MSSHSLDVESFINEVKKYPEIWDLNNEDNRHKSRKLQAWSEIGRVFFNDFDDMSNTDKMEIYRTLCGKWRNIRDSYVRHVKHRYAKRGYKHAKYLSFLNNVYTQNSQSGSEVDLDENWHSDTEESKSKTDKKAFDMKTELMWTSDAEDEQPLVETRKRKKPKKDFEYVEAFPERGCSFIDEDEDRLSISSIRRSLEDSISRVDVEDNASHLKQCY